MMNRPEDVLSVRTIVIERVLRRRTVQIRVVFEIGTRTATLNKVEGAGEGGIWDPTERRCFHLSARRQILPSLCQTTTPFVFWTDGYGFEWFGVLNAMVGDAKCNMRFTRSMKEDRFQTRVSNQLGISEVEWAPGKVTIAWIKVGSADQHE